MKKPWPVKNDAVIKCSNVTNMYKSHGQTVYCRNDSPRLI